MSIRLIVGLGNPGEKYQRTRHNFGFQVLDTYAEILSLDWKKWRQMGVVAEVDLPERAVGAQRL